MNNLQTVVIASAIVLVGFGLVSTYYSHYANTNMIEMTNDGIQYKLKRNIPLYVYSSTPKVSRKWSSFYDRTHKDPRSDLLQVCDNTHTIHHKIGKVVHVSDEDLVGMIPNLDGDMKITAETFQYNRVLRDILLLSIVCKTGGILIPRNTFLMHNTELLYTQAREPGTILYSGSGNNEYSCPIIVSTGDCDEFANVLLKEARANSLRGGVMFGGGISLVLDRSKHLYSRMGALSGVKEIDTHELIQVGEYTSRDLAIRIPFPQASGSNTIPRRDEWIYSTNVEDLMMNPTVLRSIIVQSCDSQIRVFIEKEGVL